MTMYDATLRMCIEYQRMARDAAEYGREMTNNFNRVMYQELAAEYALAASMRLDRLNGHA